MTRSDKEKKRRFAHSEIERRRREKINACLEQLKELVPTSANQIRLHQVEILENAVLYIKSFKNSAEGEKTNSPKQKSMDIGFFLH
jgi:hypothetical protein